MFPVCVCQYNLTPTLSLLPNNVLHMLQVWELGFFCYYGYVCSFNNLEYNLIINLVHSPFFLWSEGLQI